MAMSQVLLIDDDASLLEVLGLAFEDAGYEVISATDGDAGMARIRCDQPDIVVSDVNMPRLDGFALCRQLRAEENPVPLILLTSRDNEIDEALGLELGADDYVAKPFSTRVLVARVTALLRRDRARAGDGATSSLLVVDALKLDPERLEVRWRDKKIEVTVTEFRLLEVLARRPGVVFSRDRLLDLLRGDDVVVADRLIDTYVRRLRRKLEAVDPRFDRVETVIGAGYRWRD